MESSKLIFEERRKLYCSKYDYKVSMFIDGVSHARYAKNIIEYRKAIERTKSFQRKYLYPDGVLDKEWDVWDSDRKNWETYWLNIDFDMIDRFLTWKVEHKDESSLRIERNKLSIFLNDISLLESIKDINPVYVISKAVVLEAGVMFFKKQPKFKYRTYFKRKAVTLDFLKSMESFIKLYKKDDSMKISCNRPDDGRRLWYMPSGFIDYNNESILTLLHMHFGGMIGDTYKLEKHPKK